MNRRHFLAGGLALAGQHKLLSSLGSMPLGAKEGAQLLAPHNLLSTTYSRSFLESKLVPFGQWHPYPTWSERPAWDAVPEDIRTAIIERAEADRKAGWKALLATTFLDFKRNGNRSLFEADSFGRRNMLQHLVLAECLEGKGRFVDDIVNGLWLICEETFWGVPAHLVAQKAGAGLPDVSEPVVELFSAETAQLLSWTRYLLAPQLDQVSPLINKRIKLEAERRVLKPARERKDFTWMGLGGPELEYRLNNWCPWINSNLIVANLLLEDDPALRIEETVRITRSVDAYLNEYWSDAAEEEGPVYFTVSVMSLFEVLTALESATGNSTNILANPFLGAMGRFILNTHIANNYYVSYGDASGQAAPPGDVLYRFGKAVNDGQLQAFGSLGAAKSGWNAKGEGLQRALNENLTSLSRSIPALLEANEIRTARQQNAHVRDAWYPDFGLMTARVKEDSTNGMYVAVLASNNGRSHNHNDTGNFVIYQDGKPVVIDVGVEAYTAKTFSADRYSIWTMQSAYHNLPTIGGIMEHNGVEFAATDRLYSSDDERATVSFNIARAYPIEAGIKNWVRTVTLDRRQNKVAIEDNFELEHAVPISLTVMTPRVPTAAVPGRVQMNLAGGSGNAALLSFNSQELSAKVEKIDLSDPHLRESWGESIYRILLNSNRPVTKGKYVCEFCPS
jgi:hypothetical protein